MHFKLDSLRLFTIATAASIAVAFSGCAKQEVSLHGSEDSLASRTVTQSAAEIVYPDASPSVPDGKVIYERMACAQCHSQTGQPVPGKSSIDFSQKEWSHKQKPVDQFEFIYFGKPGVEHPTVRDRVTRRQAWDLVFYVRSLGQPLLDEKTLADVDAVFGSNCAVCHGKKGNGDGPLSKNLEPMPANFQLKERFFDRTDDMLWDHIANGIKWEGMPNFLGKEDKAKSLKFDQEYIWKLVEYVRHFHETNEPTLAQNPEGKDSNKSTMK
jgi:mono/diheme cytochrome c family protein